MNTKQIEIVVRCKPFSHYPMGMHRALITDDGQVKIHDDIAGCYTSVHALSPRSQARIIKAAK